MTRGQTPLTCAAANSSVPVVQFLLEQGADVNKTMVDGTHPLHVAILAGSPEMVKCMVSVPNVQINAKRIDDPKNTKETGYTPLQYVRKATLHLATND